MKIGSFASLAAAVSLGMTALSAQQPSEALQLSRSLNEKYIAAFQKADAQAVSALYAEDAQYSNDAGVTVTGRTDLTETFGKFFKNNQGATLTTEITSSRFVTPDVLVEKGLARVTTGDETETTRYTASYVKKGDAWLISDIDETELPPATEASEALSDLQWLVGTWKDAGENSKVETHASWTLNQHFMRRSFTVTREDDSLLEGTEVIGYDAKNGQIRSWTFDSEGGFAEAVWRQDGNKWLISTLATLADGGMSSAQNVITITGDGKFTWESINRTVDGEALPNLDKIEVVRTKNE